MESINDNNQMTKPAMPASYLARSIVSIILCFPFGIPAVINSARVTELWLQGKYAEAEEASAKAKKWSKISIVITIVFGVLYALFMTLYWVFVFALFADEFSCY